MVIIYKAIARYLGKERREYTELGYYLSRSAAYSAAFQWNKKRSALCSADKIIVQEISITADGAYIRDCDWIECE